MMNLEKEPTYNTGRTGQHSIGPWWQDVLLPESREHLADADDGGLRGNPQCLTHLQEILAWSLDLQYQGK